jgi:uncharacterized protein
MDIRELIFNIQKVYDEMAETFSKFQKDSGLACLSGCGRCCMNPEVEASTLEMLPWALKVYDEGLSEQWLEKLQDPVQEYCLMFQPGSEAGQGKCGNYTVRPSVCRMFGVAGYLNKHGEKTLSVCKFIRESCAEKTKNFEANLPPETPVISQWSNNLSALGEPALHNKIPINTAMHNALVRILFYFQYHS